MDAENTHQVFDWLWSSGQLSARDIESLSGLGIELVINLALPTSSNALPGEAELVTGEGIAYVHIPVEWESPRSDQFQQFVGVLNSFRGRKVWVHCAKNMRVSAFVYLYRKLVLGEEEDEATFPMREVWIPNDVWQRFIEQVRSAFAHTRSTPD
ncbi:MAG TPA: protein tyrosine phosphatase family protein [Steroidobacteraceae bacterium]|nr:protein tyrosine phosphatase family protein [Steroidobacteraceae bacterium]